MMAIPRRTGVKSQTLARRGGSHRPRAFTLIELLVVISIIALLMSILLPTLAGARRRARTTVGVVNLRSLSQIMAMYTNEHHEEFLNPFRKVWPRLANGYIPVWTEAVSVSNPDHHWDFDTSPYLAGNTEGFSAVWYSYLAEYRSGFRLSQEQYSPNDAELLGQFREAKTDPSSQSGATIFPGSYLYSPTFWSKQERYTLSMRDAMTPETLRTMALADVVHPAAKVFLWERADFSEQKTRFPASYQGRINIALVDGSIDIADVPDIAQRGVAAGATGNDADLLPCFTQAPNIGPLFFYATRRGVSGRDIPRN